MIDKHIGAVSAQDDIQIIQKIFSVSALTAQVKIHIILNLPGGIEKADNYEGGQYFNGYEAGIPGSGLLVYRVNTSQSSNYTGTSDLVASGYCNR